MGDKKKSNTNNKRNTATSKRKPKLRQFSALGPEILWKYPGKFIVYSEDEKRVIGVGETEEEAIRQAEASGVKGLWHSAYADRPGELII